MTRTQYAALLVELRSEWRLLVARVELEAARRRGPRRAALLAELVARPGRRARR